MTIEEKNNTNKEIRKYTGTNTFIISLQKVLKNNKYLERVDIGGRRKIKILSDKQYETAIDILKY